MARKSIPRSAPSQAVAAAAAAAPLPRELTAAPADAAPLNVLAAPTHAPFTPPALETAAPQPTEALDAAMEQINAMREMLRQSSEATLQQGRAMYDRLKQTAEETTGSFETAFETAKGGVVEINMKAIETLKANTDAAFGYMRALAGVKSFTELMELQSEHARRSCETFAAQSRDFAQMAQKVADDSAAPLKNVLGRPLGAAA
ncbi:MAG TPA: phasin family protein [Beijerinckiaceae bacterium]